MPTISFITANYVARLNGYNGDANWGVHDNATVERTNRAHWDQVVRDIKAAGFSALDIWMAHCHWKRHTRQHLKDVKDVCRKHGLAITSYAGGLSPTNATDIEAPFAFMRDLGAPILAGGLFGGMPASEAMPLIDAACERWGVRYALENHPEKSIQEIEAKIGGERFPRVGVALDTGWCATQQFDALEAAKHFAAKGKLFILHLKDVTQPGGHTTCAVGDGVVPCEPIVRHLKQTGWDGTICIEHEPYDHDPMPEAITSLQRVREWLS